jgi:hypothetical protein
MSTGRSRRIGLWAAPVVVLALGVGLWFWHPAILGQTRAPQLSPAPIDGERAFGYLRKLVDFGPRPAGSEANEKQRKFVAEHFKKLGGEVSEQPFQTRDPQSGRPVSMANLVGSWFPDRAERLLICAHYDTRPHPDQEFDPQRRNLPFYGANDGASGVALLMEIAHHLKDMDTPYGVDLVLFDGEELVYDRVGEYFLGAKEFGRRYKAGLRDKNNKKRYVAGILLDMIGDADLNIAREVNSQRLAPQVVREVFDVAARLKARGFVAGQGHEVLDDHLSLNEAGIPTADLIDFDYPEWHTADDLPDKCSPASLVEVGRVVTAWIGVPGKGKRTR